MFKFYAAIFFTPLCLRIGFYTIFVVFVVVAADGVNWLSTMIDNKIDISIDGTIKLIFFIEIHL